jgi:hypothetical protein
MAVENDLFFCRKFEKDVRNAPLFIDVQDHIVESRLEISEPVPANATVIEIISVHFFLLFRKSRAMHQAKAKGGCLAWPNGNMIEFAG